jgi:hypothetical protein
MAKDGNADPPDLFSIAAQVEPKVPVSGGEQPPMNIARHQLDLFVAFIGDVPLRDDRRPRATDAGPAGRPPRLPASQGRRRSRLVW